jgi:antitoxin component YwqK of YwqJK toxin-antitoxin module
MYSTDGRMIDNSFFANERISSETVFNPFQPDYTINPKFQGEKTLNYPNGSPFLKYSVVCGQLKNFERFYPDGKSFNKTSYAGNSVHGSFEQLDEFGNVAKKGTNVLGNQHGVWMFYNELGKPDQTVRYVYGKIDSILTAYYEFGGVYFTSEYSDGSRNGITHVFAPDGTPIVEKKYKEGAIIELRTTGKNGQFGEWKPFSANINIVAYYPGGTKSYEEEYTAGTLSNVKRIYFPDGKLCMEYHYLDGGNHGPFVVNYPSGKTCLKGQYRLGEMDGVFEVFQENGMPLKTITYKMGAKIGPTTVFKNGVKSREIIYFGYPVK